MFPNPPSPLSPGLTHSIESLLPGLKCSPRSYKAILQILRQLFLQPETVAYSINTRPKCPCFTTITSQSTLGQKHWVGHVYQLPPPSIKLLLTQSLKQYRACTISSLPVSTTHLHFLFQVKPKRHAGNIYPDHITSHVLLMDQYNHLAALSWDNDTPACTYFRNKIPKQILKKISLTSKIKCWVWHIYPEQ